MKNRTRAIWILVGLACGFTVVSFNLIQIQLAQHDRYQKMAIKNHLSPEKIDPVRGKILDAEGNLLAETQIRTDLYLDGKLLDQPAKQLSQIAEALQISSEKLFQKFDPKDRHQNVAMDLAVETVGRLRALKMKSLIFVPHDERFYPNNEMASHILGYVSTPPLADLFLDCRQVPNPQVLTQVASILQVAEQQILARYNPTSSRAFLSNCITDKLVVQLRALKIKGLIFATHDEQAYPSSDVLTHGQTGIEKEMDALLCGVPGQRWVERDGLRREIPGYEHPETPAVDGYDVTLTVRMAIQHIVETELDKIVQTYSPNAAYIIIMDPHTGQILGMGSRPTYDPNLSKSFKPENLRNRCISDPVEPGSIFKIITIAAALNEGMVTLKTPIFCENGSFSYAGKVLHDDEKEGTLPVIEVLSKSSNIGCAKIAINYLHEQKLYNYAAAFGIGRRTGLFTQQGESPGLLRPVSKWSSLSISRIPMGQEVSSTPIQMAAAMSIIANGGKRIVPHLVDKVTDATGRVIQEYPTQAEQVISPETARDVATALQQVTIDGTAKGIQILDSNGNRYSYAGKTGTAQKFVDGAYSHEKFVASFVGFMPAKDPAFVALVMVDEPHTKPRGYYGSVVSAPVFASIGRQMAQILNLQPDLPKLTSVLTAKTGEDE